MEIRPKLYFFIFISFIFDVFFSYTDMFFGVSSRIYFMIIVIGLFFMEIAIKKKTFTLSKTQIKIISTYSLFILISFFINIFNGVNIYKIANLYLGNYVYAFVVMILIMILINDKVKLKQYVFFLILLVTFNSFIGILQYFDIGFAWQIRDTLGYGGLEVVRRQIISRERIVGLSLYSIPFSYLLCTVLPINIIIFLYSKKKSIKRTILKFAFILNFLALILSGTRSALLGVSVSIFIIIIRNNKWINKLIYILTSFIFFVLSFFVFNLRNMRMFSINTSVYSRIPLAIVGFKIFADNPLGAGMGAYAKYSTKYYNLVQDMRGAEQILNVGSSHNQFINIAVYYGVIGLILSIIFYYFIFKSLNFIKNNTNNKFNEMIAVALQFSFLSYIINSLFHNGGPFMGDVINFYFIGLVLGFINISRKKYIGGNF